MRKKILEALSAVFVFFLLLSPAVIGGTIESTYYINAEVVAIEGDEVLIVDEDGEAWSFYGDDFRIGDKVKARFFTNGTDSTRLDDEIEKVTKR